MWFLQVLGVIALVVLVALVIGAWWLRRWWKRTMTQATQVQRSLDPILSWPARLQLSACEVDAQDDSLALHWPRWVEAGFSRLGDYQSDDGLAAIRLASHPTGMTLCLAVDPMLKPCATLYAVSTDGSFLALSEAPGTGARTPKLQWHVATTREPAAQCAQLQALADAAGQTPRPLTARIAVAAIERGYAVWRDQQLAQPPTPAAIEARLAASGQALGPQALQAAIDQHRSRWRELLAVAALDVWRQSAKPDAETWARLQDEIEVIPESISDAEVTELLGGDERADQLLAQTAAQGLSGLKRYAAVVERLGLGQRRHELARLARPVPLRLYVRDAAETPEAAPAEVRTYVYRVEGGESGSVLATSVADARNQLRGMGLADADIVHEPNALSGPTDRLLWEPDAAAIAAIANEESIARALLRALAANVWLWLPPIPVLWWAFSGDAGFGLGQGVAVVYALLSYGLLLWLMLPMALYNRVLAGKATARLSEAKNLMTVLRLIRPLGMTAAQIQRELASIEFAMGQTEAGLRRLQTLRPTLDDAGWYETLATALGSSGDFDALIDAQQRAMALAQDPTLLKIDLCLSLLRYRRDVAGADALLAEVAPGSLSTTSLAGYHYARGLLLAEREQHGAALRQFRSAIDGLAAFKGNPLVGTLTTEIEAFAALSLRADGRRDDAEALWASVWPRLSRHRSTRYLEKRWAEAIG
ncbi:MAG: hypothetical protein MUE46_00565 [Xanthomonadales bacterium]|jgi:tetratricopeptide (TPR) repeat protein|nr:hypothetical protein [Xanthomonadales bacterium]